MIFSIPYFFLTDSVYPTGMVDLITMVGSISYMMTGVEAALNGMVIDMMKEFKKAKEQIAEQDSKELNI